MHTLEFNKSDWDNIDPKDRNVWQSIAAHTKGYATLGNVVTLLGLTISLIGVREIYHNNLSLGIYLLVIGRVADVLDGFVAALTKTKSRTGEALDAGTDKLIGVVALVAFAIKSTVPLVPLLLIFIRSLINTIFSFTARIRGKELHSSPIGKYAEFTEWLLLLSFIIAKLADEHDSNLYQGIFGFIGYTFLVAFIVLATDSTIGYGMNALQKKSSKKYSNRTGVILGLLSRKSR